MTQAETIYYLEPVPPQIHLFWRQRVKNNFSRLNIFSGNGVNLEPEDDVRILGKTYRVYDQIERFRFDDIPYPISAEKLITLTDLIGKTVLLIVDHNTKL